MPTAPKVPSPEQRASAADATALPHGPADISDGLLRLQRRPPDLGLQESYLQQRYRFRRQDTELVLHPGDPALAGLPRLGPTLGVVHLLSGWSPHGRSGSLYRFQRLQAALAQDVRDLGGGSEAGAAVAADGSWFEGQLLVRGLNDLEALRLARRYGQPAALRWADGHVTVLPTGLQPAVQPGSVPVVLSRLPAATCPVRCDVDPTGRCASWGGGWTSGSIHAASLWSAHRGAGVQLLGCDACDNGREPAWGGAPNSIGGAGILLASRYSSSTWPT